MRAVAPVAPAAAARGAGWLLLAGMALFVALTFDQHGISNDEEVQHVYGRLLLDFYGSGFAERAAFEYKNLYLYGGLFDLLAAGLERLLPAVNVWDLRHLLSAGFGLLGLGGTWLLARLLAGERVALLALVLLALAGPWSGAMFTHTKDIPFATTMVWSLLFSVRILATLPRPRIGDVLSLGLALGCAFGLRVGAVFAVFYLAVGLCAAAGLQGGGMRARAAYLGRALVALWPAALLALALTSLFWPWAVMSPANLFKAMTTFSHFAFELDTILDGQVMKNGDVPGHYLAYYLLVRLPELFLLGLVPGAIAAFKALPALGDRTRALDAVPWLAFVLAAVFPLAYTLLAAPPLYNGLRHFTFLLPPLAVVSALGLGYAWERAGRLPRTRALAAAGCAALALGHGVTLARLHPYEYVYYNGIAGGLRGADGKWEQDYWASSVRELATQLNLRIAAEAPPERRYKVAVCAEPLQAAVWLGPQFEVTRDWWAADFFLTATHMDCDAALKGAVIGEVVRDGVVLAEIHDRRALRGDERRPR